MGNFTSGRELSKSCEIFRNAPRRKWTRKSCRWARAEVHHPSGDIVTYAYNGDGLRVWQDDGVDEVRYVHDGNNVLLETEGLGTVEAEFTYIPQAYAQVISQLRSGDSALEMGSGVNSAQHPAGHLAIDS